MASAGKLVELFGRGTSVINGYDSIENMGPNNIDKLNTSAQLAAASAGVFAGLSPGTAISAGLLALDTQFTKFVYDINNNASFSTYASDTVGLFSDVAIIGGGVASYLDNKPMGTAFGILGATTDIAGVAFNHPGWVMDKAQAAIDSISSAGSSAASSLGNMLENLKNNLSNYSDQTNYQNINPSQEYNNTLNTVAQNFSAIINNVGIESISSYIPESDTATKTTWGGNNGDYHEIIDGDTIQLPEIHVTDQEENVGANTAVNVFGSQDKINMIANSGSYVGVFGQNQTLNGDTGNNTANIGGDGTSAIVSGANGVGGYVGLVGNNQSLTLTNWGATVQTASGVTGENISGSYSSITLGGNASAGISGSNDTLGFGGSNGFAGIQGTGETINNNDASNLVNINGNGSSATVNGDVSIGLYGSNQSVTLDNAGDHLTVYGGFTSEGINGTGDTITLGGNASAGISGSNDILGFAGSNSFAGIQGTGETISNNDASNLVNINGNGSSATVNGDVSIGLYGSNQSVTLDSSGDHLTVYGGFNGEGINATGDTVALGGNAGANISGNGNTINLQGNSGDQIGVTGTGVVVSGDSGNDTVNLGAGTSATVYGGGYVGLCGNDDTLNLDGGNFTIATVSGVREETINGSNETIELPSNVHVTVNGSGDTIYGMQGGDDVTINGSYDTFDGNADEVNLEGNISSDREGGDNDSFFDNGSYAGGTNNDGGFGSDPGDGDEWDDFDPVVLNLQGQAVQTVGIDRSQAALDIHGTGTRVKVGWGTPGEGYLVDLPAGKSAVTGDSDLVASFAALRALDSNHDGRIDAHDAAWSNLKVWVDPTGHADPSQGSLVSLDQLGIASIDIDATPDRHSDNGNVILNDSTFTRKDGSTGDISGVAFRAAGDGSHPVSPLTILPPAAIAAAPPSLAAQASQLAAAMAAFGGAGGSETGLHTVPAAVQGTLTIDPSQTGHATQPLRHAA